MFISINAQIRINILLLCMWNIVLRVLLIENLWKLIKINNYHSRNATSMRTNDDSLSIGHPVKVSVKYESWFKGLLSRMCMGKCRQTHSGRFVGPHCFGVGSACLVSFYKESEIAQANQTSAKFCRCPGSLLFQAISKHDTENFALNSCSLLLYASHHCPYLMALKVPLICIFVYSLRESIAPRVNVNHAFQDLFPLIRQVSNKIICNLRL